MKTPPIVSPQEWEAARQQLLAKEKGLTRARDALAAERRRMPHPNLSKIHWRAHLAARALATSADVRIAGEALSRAPAPDL
jgi:predicted dithiol-disulfide oxidoreductase (DUF899 family)